MDTGELIRSLTDELEQHTIEIRHEIHANPELSFHEFATSRIVCRELDRIGVHYEESPCKPGIIATIDSGKPGKFLMLRADMDALPIQEKTGLPFESKVPGAVSYTHLDVYKRQMHS